MTKVTQLNLDEEGGPDRRRIHLREISGDSESPLETVGQDLRAARLRRGDEIATVSRALKIRKDHLAAVEDDNLERLPGKTYAIGFVRSYAAYLGLDAVRMVERFKQEIAGRQDEETSQMAAMHLDDGRRLPNGWRAVTGIVVLGLLYGAWHLFSAGPSPQPVPPAPALNAPRQQVASAAPVAEQRAVPSPAIDNAAAADAPPPTNPQSAGSAGASTVSQPAAVPSPALSATPSAAVPPQGNAVTGQVYGERNKDARVVLRARGDTHILIRGRDGMVYINRTMKTGDSYRLPNIVGLSLTTTNAGAVELDLDGAAMGRAGADLQTVGDIELDPQAIVDRFNGNR